MTDKLSGETIVVPYYFDFCLYVDCHGAFRPDRDGHMPSVFVRVFESPVGEGEHAVDVCLDDWGYLLDCTNRLATRDKHFCTEEQEAFFRRLGDILFPIEVREMLVRCLDFVRNDYFGLRIRLRLFRELSILPWEYMIVELHDDEDDSWRFLALRPRLSIVRHEQISVPARPFSQQDSRRVLVAMANPRSEKYGTLDIATEQKTIRKTLDDMAGVTPEYHPDFAAGEESRGVTEQQLIAALQKETDIFHFSGHGEFVDDEKCQGFDTSSHGAIIVVGENDDAKSVPGDDLARLLEAGHVRLAVLESCKSAQPDPLQNWSGIAQALLKGRIPAVVAMQFTIHDDMAQAFCQQFYNSLVVGGTIDEAVSNGRLAMWRKDNSRREWGVPVLYMRNAGGKLFGCITNPEIFSVAYAIEQQRSTLNDILLSWLRDSAPASPEQLDYLQCTVNSAELDAATSSLLLSSALVHCKSLTRWTKELGNHGRELLPRFDDWQDIDVLHEQTVLARQFGLNSQPDSEATTLQESTGRLLWQAVHQSESIKRQISILARAVSTDPGGQDVRDSKMLAALNVALNSLSPGAKRARTAELCGILSEADQDMANRIHQETIGIQDRIGIWHWRMRRRLRRDRTRICRWSLGGAVGAALTLAIYRAVIGILSTTSAAGTEFAIYSYWGFLLGLAVTFGLMIAYPFALCNHDYVETRFQKRTSLIQICCGALSFGLANMLVTVLNGAGFEATILAFPPAVLMGASLAFSLRQQPWLSRWPRYHPSRMSRRQWLIRLGSAFLLVSILQLPVLCIARFRQSAEWRVASVVVDPNWITNGFSAYTPLENTFARCTPGNERTCCFSCEAASAADRLFANCLEEWLVVLDAGTVAVLLVIGISIGIHASELRFREWRIPFRTNASKDKV